MVSTGAIILVSLAILLLSFSNTNAQTTTCTSTVPTVSINRNASSFVFAAQVQEPSTSSIQIKFEYGTNDSACVFSTIANDGCAHGYNLELTPYQFVTCGIQRNETDTAIVFNGAVVVSVTDDTLFERVFRYPFRISFKTQVNLVQSFSVVSGANLAASLRLQKQMFDVSKRAGVIEGLINYSSEFSLVSYNATATNAASLNLINNGVTCVDPSCAMRFALEAYIAAFECTFSGVYRLNISASNVDLGLQSAEFAFNIASED